MTVPQIFDRRAYAMRRARATRRHGTSFLVADAVQSLAERLSAVNRQFHDALDLGSRAQAFDALRSYAERWVRASLVADGLAPPHAIVADEETLPFAAESFDLVTSVLSLHAVNDLPGTLLQIRRALRPDGLFLAALFGGSTLKELREALSAGESETRGGISAHVAPFADVRDLGGLLQRAGFALPVADVERSVVLYAKLATLVDDLRQLGETNALALRQRTGLSRPVLAESMARYAAEHAQADGKLRATFEIVYLTGWAPHESQQKPLSPGTAKVRLADALGTKEQPAGDRAAPQRKDL